VPSRLPLALVVIPLSTLLGLAFSMVPELTDGRLVYARVWGGPPSEAVAVRVQVIEEEIDLARGTPEFPVTVEITTPVTTVVRTGRTGAEGWADVSLPLPPGGSASDYIELEVRAASPDSATLARGRVVWARAAWLALAGRASALVAPSADGPRPIGLRFEPPVLSVPFPAVLVIELSALSQAPVLGRVELIGARLLAEPTALLTPGVPTRLRFQPLEHTGTMTFRARTPAGEVAHSVTLPVRAGSLTAASSGDDLTILSPVPRPRAYYTVASPAGRLGGGVVSLGPRPDGTAAGRLARGDLPPGTDRYLVLSSTPDGLAPALVGLPLDGQKDTFDARDVLLLDGRPRALSTQRAQRLRLRWALFFYAAVGTMLSLVLFAWHIRRANERLSLDLAEAGAPVEARDRSLSGPMGALLSLLFAFGLALTWILVR
jgi:hypothetical protein